MNVCVFVGPTLPVADAAGVLECVYLPPVKLGDVHRAVSLLRPRAVGIIDGYFQWAPAVWHKEILWAIDRGTHVFGAASMGALRAAELAPLGMRGVGRIFEAYRDGLLEGAGDGPFEDDDEVAVVHGPPEGAYVGASEAMVNIRCTLAAALRAGVIGEVTRLRLVAIAKSIFFPERGYAIVLEHGRAAGLPERELASLQRWLPSGRVNQKRADAVAMLEAMRAFLADDPPPARPGFTFERTTLWERAAAALRPPAIHDPASAAVLAELRVDAPRCELLRENALLALMAMEAEDTAAGAARIEQAAREEAARRLRAAVPTVLIERKMLALLREAGSFEALRARAERKRSMVAGLAQLPEVDEFSELQLLELRDWYFSQVAGTEMPDDLEGWVQESGYADPTDFHRAVLAEYLYRNLTGSGPSAPDGVPADGDR